MKKNNILILIILFTTLSYGQIEFSGFMDLLHTTDLEESNSLFSYGQFELDLAMGISKKILAIAAVAYNAEDEVMGMGAGFLDYHLFGGEEYHPASGEILPHSGLIIGQFDVPFGLDYLSIPSPDRALISAPLLNRKTIDGWNDVGVNLYGVISIMNYSLSYVNGLGNNYSFGGRVELSPVENINIGTSFAKDIGDVESKIAVFGVDISAELATHQVKFEYIQAENCLDGILSESSNSGYYGEVFINFETYVSFPMYAVVRYGAWTDGTDDESEIASGLGFNINDNASIRAEYLQEKVNDEVSVKTLIFQTVVSF